MIFNNVKKYFSLVTFSHTLFAMPFALIGYILAVKKEGFGFSWSLLLMVVLCMVFARNAAMAFNRYIDREIDKKNPRTSLREIPLKILSPSSALMFVFINSVLFISVTWFMTKLVFILSPVALMVILGYSFTKRFTSLCHFVLGLGLSLAPIGAFLSVTGYFGAVPLLFSFTVLFWVSGFDIIYALQDEDFDKKNALRSIPVVLGRKKSLFLSSFLHLISTVFLIFAGIVGSFGFLFWTGFLIFILLLVYQHSIVKINDLSKVNMAFATLNGFASVIFATFAIIDILLSK